MGTRVRLSAMMCLAYAVQGAWWPLLSIHLDGLKIEKRQGGWLFATLAIAALITPPIAGRIADRSLSAQKLLTILYALGTGLLLTFASGLFRTFAGLFPAFLLYWLVLIPYLNLTNAVAMRNLSSPREEFGAVRLWGTVGWMAAGWLVSAVMSLGGFGPRVAFAVGAALAATMVLVTLTLPDTPPLATSSRGLPIREAIELARRPGVVVLLACGFLVSLTTPFVYQAVPIYLHRGVGLDKSKVTAALSLGQVPEILALGILPLVVHRLGRKATLAAGIAAWVAYHGLFALRPGLAVSLLAIPLNGVAIALFHVVAPMYLDSQAPPDHRAGVQGLWVMTTSGLGSLCGGLMAGEVMQRAGDNWRLIFAVPAMIAAVAFGLVIVAFRSRARPDPHSPPLSAQRPTTPVPLLRTGGARIE
jgi:MFS family permease